MPPRKRAGGRLHRELFDALNGRKERPDDFVLQGIDDGGGMDSSAIVLFCPNWASSVLIARLCVFGVIYIVVVRLCACLRTYIRCWFASRAGSASSFAKFSFESSIWGHLVARWIEADWIPSIRI